MLFRVTAKNVGDVFLIETHWT